MASEEMLRALNEETSHKLMEEKDKFDTLKSDHIELTEELVLMRRQITDDSVYNKETEVIIANLRKEIEVLEKDVNVK